MEIQVGIIEDDLDLATAMKNLLNESEGFCCKAVFHQADDAIKSIPKLDLDVVLTDIHLDGKSGIDCVLALKPLCPTTRFLICTSFEDSETVFKALKVGATGYLVKSVKPSVLLDAIQDAFQGGSPMSSQIARMVVQSFHQQQNKELEKLSQREQEILDLLSKGFRYKQIADKLFISTTTVRTHIYNIYQKLQVNTRTEALNKIFKK